MKGEGSAEAEDDALRVLLNNASIEEGPPPLEMQDEPAQPPPDSDNAAAVAAEAEAEAAAAFAVSPRIASARVADAAPRVSRIMQMSCPPVYSLRKKRRPMAYVVTRFADRKTICRGCEMLYENASLFRKDMRKKRQVIPK